MSQERRRPSRRSVLRGLGASAVPLSAGRVASDPASEAVDDAVKTAPSVFGEVGRRINAVRYPLVGVPAVVEPGETLRVELDVERLPDSVSASLEPSFGAATPETELPLVGIETDVSRIWGDRIYAVARFEVPGTGRRFTDGLYDLRVTVDGEVDGQPRAVSVRDPFPEAPEIAVMGDPHVGDPRPFRDGGRESLEAGDPDPFLFRYRETFGTGTEEDRWGAFQRANAELNAENPDLVVVIGDLAFGSADYYQEYEDAYRVLNQLNAPTYVTLGNHDGYVTPGAGIDGKELYRRYFAPWYYGVDIRPDLHFVSMDSYDWPALDRVAPSAVPSTFGGQVRDPQFEWLADDLRSWRAANPDGTILTLSHHNPSWRRTEKGEATRTTDGIPGAEQAARGAERSGGGWLGDNRLAVRNLLAEVRVTLHISGHAHRDRVARYHGDDTVVATTGTGLEHVGPENELLETPPDEKRDILSEGDGPLFVEATTAASGTSQYWGWRTATLNREGKPLDPRTFGYPATDEFLEERALQPELWSDDNADLGLYSTPSYLVDAEVVTATDRCVTIRIDSDLARPLTGAATLPLSGCAGARVENAEVVWRRVDGDAQDIRVAFEVPAGGTLEVTARCTSKEDGSPNR
jgi:3',5'-cyclic AMP phosphodiesterase CpdA